MLQFNKDLQNYTLLYLIKYEIRSAFYNYKLYLSVINYFECIFDFYELSTKEMKHMADE